ncbi:heme o synthase [Halobiforma nitratireducens]|uniref:Protoheme IX farnesyltransferase n=1 Tax=Halobiforma nitratireducens JCM 10879 TaxID=1227454 RepID=M0L5R7_9EURY|nr:heme o synthase [Halobiforma nitratireducens]EMA27335.1 protoheme IX farnesyltransferase [Halobiforma nitratireducens JCM 10879]
MIPTIDRRRFGDLLGATAIAAYLLIALGTAVSTTGSGSSCTTWPSCSTDWTIGPMTGEALLFWSHRAAALLAGVLVVSTALAAWRLDVDWRVKAGVAVALVLFPVQVALGAMLVVGGSTLVSVAHLLFAMVIFGGLLGALIVALENRALEDAGERADEFTEPIDPDPSLEPDDSDEPVATEPTADRVQVEDLEPLERLRRTAGAYLTLTKPKLVWLLCLVALAGIGLATVTGESVAVSTVLATLLGGTLAIGASGTFNHVLERDRDRQMDRTNDRPLVHDLVPVRNAVAFGSFLVAASMTVMLTWVNALAAVLTLAAIAYYVVLYTAVLKPNTSWNTVLGGGAGALPALIGWAAVTGSVGLPALVLAAVIFWWTPAHFYSLAIAYREDYANGGFPMFPVVEGVLTARRHVLLFLGATLLSASLLGWLAGLGWLYTLTSVALGGVFLRSVVRQYREPTDDAALRSFYVSNYYLGAILVAIVLETVVVA